jgi:hypothetical protein
MSTKERDVSPFQIRKQGVRAGLAWRMAERHLPPRPPARILPKALFRNG